jgi:hypothetical protein
MRLVLAARLAFAGWVLGVAYLSLTENPETVRRGFEITRWIAETLLGDEALSDKVAHFLSYLALGALAAAARLPIPRGFLALVTVLAGYGVLLEVLQGLGGVRTPDALDALTNLAGAALGTGAALLLRSRAEAAA